MEEVLERISYLIERGKVNINTIYPADLKDQNGVDEVTREALESGIEPEIILKEALIKGMLSIGEKFRDRKVFVPDVLAASKAMLTGLEHIKPFFNSNKIAYKGKIVIGTVQGDIHDIGKNILSMIIQGGGWQVIDLGVNVSKQKFIDAVKEHAPRAVCLSALLTTTMVNMQPIIYDLKNNDSTLKVLVGGAPVNIKFANSINADFYSPHPSEALTFLDKIIQ